MKHALFPLIALVLVPATAADAAVRRPMEARPSFTQLQQTCMDMEGAFAKSPDGKGYACTTTNCDGKGGSCTVACDNDQNCTAETPSRILHPVSLRGILQNGDNIVRGGAPLQSTGGSNSESGSSSSPGEPDWPDGPIF